LQKANFRTNFLKPESVNFISINRIWWQALPGLAPSHGQAPVSNQF